MKTLISTMQTEPTNTRLTGVLFVLAGALGFSAKAVLVKLAFAAQADLDVITLMALRMGLALPFFVVIALFLNKTKKNAQFSRDTACWVITWPVILISGV